MMRLKAWAGAALIGLAFWGVSGATAGAADAEQVTAAEARTHASESWVMLEGHIVESLGNERYRFEDASGEIEVRIGPEDCRMQDVKKNTLVKVHGQLKKRGDRIEVHADRVVIAD